MPTKFIRETRSLKVKDFIITDEFMLLEKETDLRTAIKELVAMKNGVVLVNEEVGKGKVDRILGVLTERKVLETLLKVEEPFKMNIGDAMDTDVLEIEEGEDIVKVIKAIRKERPAAVIVRDVKGDFKGYFSPMDFQEADRLLRSMSSAGELDEGEEGTDGDGNEGADAGKAMTGPSSVDGSKDISKPVATKGKAAAKGVPPKQSPKGPKAKRADEDDEDEDDDDDDDNDPKKRRRKPLPFPDDDDDEEKAKTAKATSTRGTMGIGRPTAGLGEEGCDQEEEAKGEDGEEGTGGDGGGWSGG